MLLLTVVQGRQKGKYFSLPDNEPQLIGRSSATRNSAPYHHRVSKNSQPKPTLMRNLGRFVGEIGKAIKCDPDNASRTVEVSRSTETETRETDRGTVTLRRTTVEEVVLSDADATPADRPPQEG